MPGEEGNALGGGKSPSKRTKYWPITIRAATETWQHQSSKLDTMHSSNCFMDCRHVTPLMYNACCMKVRDRRDAKVGAPVWRQEQLCIGDGDDNYLLGSHSGRHHNPLHQKIALIRQ